MTEKYEPPPIRLPNLLPYRWQKLVFEVDGVKHRGEIEIEMYYRPRHRDGDQPPERIIEKARNRAIFRTGDAAPRYLRALGVVWDHGKGGILPPGHPDNPPVKTG